MASRFWVGGAGTWDTSSTTHWSATDGGASGASVPTAADDVTINGNSGTPGAITLTGALTCLSLTINVTGWTVSGTGTLAVSGGLSLNAGTTWSATGTVTFNATTSVAINTNNVSMACATTFNGVGGIWTLSSAFVCTGRATLTAGTLAQATFDFTCQFFTGSGATTRSITTTGGFIVVTGAGAGTIVMTTQTNFTFTGSLTFKATANSGATVFVDAGTPSEANTFNFYLNNPGAGGAQFTNGNKIRDLTADACGVTVDTALSIYGNLWIKNNGVVGGGVNVTTMAATSGTKTVAIESGSQHSGRFGFDGVGGTFQLTCDSLFNTDTTFLTNGTLDLNNFVLTTGAFTTNNTNTRTLAFGASGEIHTKFSDAQNTVFQATPTGLTVTGTNPLVVSTYTGASGVSFGPGALSEANSISFKSGNHTGGTTVAAGASVRNLTFVAGYAGALANTGFTVYGNLTILSTMTLTAGASVVTFGPTSGTKNITTAGLTFDFPITINGAGGTVQMSDALTMGVTRTFTLTAGTFDANGFATSVGLCVLTAGTLAMGSGNFNITGNGGTVLSMGTGASLTLTGTKNFRLTYGGATGTRTITGPSTGANVPTVGATFSVTAGTDSVAPTGIYNMDFTGFAGTLTNAARSIYGNLTISTGMTLTAGTNVMTFAATGTGKTITTNGKTFDFPITFDGVGGGWTLQDGFTIGVTRTTTLTNGAVTLGAFTLSTGLFATSNSNARTIDASGGGGITLTAATAVTMWTSATSTNLTVTGALVVAATGGGAVTKTINAGALTEANSISFNLQCSAGTVAFTASDKFHSLTLNGAFTLSNIAITIYGNYTYTASTTLTAGTNAWTFGGTSGTQTINANGVTLDFPVTINGAGGTDQLSADLTIGSSRLLTLTGGILDLNGHVLSTGSFATAAGTKDLTANGGTLTITGSGATAFNNASPTNFTTTKGSAYGVISMTSASAKTFVGGGSSFNFALNQGGAGALTLTGSNTLAGLTNTVQPATILFTATTTTTFTVAPTISGTSGNLITIGSVTAASHTLSMDSSLTSTVRFVTISRSTAQGGGTWNSRTAAGNVDGGNNSGWLFTFNPSLAIANATFSSTGEPITPRTATTAPISMGSFSSSGQSVVLRWGHPVTAGLGTFTMTGEPIGNRFDLVCHIGLGAFTTIGETVGLKISREFAVGYAVFASTGQSISTHVVASTHAEMGSFISSGQIVRGGFGWDLHAAVATFSMSGQSAGLTAQRFLPCVFGSFSSTGEAIDLRVSGLVAAPGTFIFSGQDAVLSYGSRMAVAMGTFTSAGQSVAIVIGHPMTAAAGVFVMTGENAAVEAILSSKPAVAIFSTAGQPVTLTSVLAPQPTVGVFTTTGEPVGMASRLSSAVTVGVFTYQGQPVGLGSVLAMSPGAATFVMTGQDTRLGSLTSISAALAVFNYSGEPVAMRVEAGFVASAASFSLNGQAVTIRTLTRKAADVGVFTMTGKAAIMRADRRDIAGCGIFTLSGQPALLISRYSAVSGVGTFTFSGQNIQTPAARIMPAALAAFTMTGEAIGARTVGVVAAAVGVFAMTGKPVNLPAAKIVAAETAAFSLSGEAVSLQAKRLAAISVGVFTSIGEGVGLTAQKFMVSAVGAFTFTGEPIDTDTAASISAAAAGFSMTGEPVAVHTTATAHTEMGAFASAGQGVVLRALISPDIDCGIFTLTGEPTRTIVAQRFHVAAGIFVFDGQAVGFAFKLLPPRGRVVTVCPRARLVTVEARDRLVTVEARDRLVTIEARNRLVTIEG